MGIKGTDVAKEAAEVVLADDNYITITQGIFEGRKFFDNLQKGIKYYLSVKVALILIFLLPVIFGIPMPLAPIQIILLELFMDLAASVGFVAEPKEKDIYFRPPRNLKKIYLICT
jgi:Ca2+-transporting ATPase